MITYVLGHDGVDLGTIFQESHTTLPIYCHSSYVLDPIPLLKGVWIQEGSLQSGFYASGSSVWGSLWYWLLLEGSGLPSLMPSPPHLTVSFPWEVFTMQGIADEMFQAATVVAAFLICLSIFYSPCQMNHKLLCYTFDSARIVTLLIFIITGILFL